MTPLKYAILRTGYCVSKESLVIRGGRPVKVEIPALIALLEHPERGPILYDAGYSSTMFPHTRCHWSSRLYMKLLPVVIPPEEDATSQLRTRGLDPSRLETMILSHFHPDHIGGVRDFPETQFLCSRDAWEQIQRRRGYRAVRRGFMPDLLPEDFGERLTLLDPSTETVEGMEAFGPAIDVLGDGSLWGISLPGHAAGQMGLLFRDGRGKRVFLCADACWYRRSYRERRLPSSLTYSLLESKGEFEQTFRHICELHHREPDLAIYPAHCPECVGASG